jgi:hypothetical protein
MSSGEQRHVRVYFPGEPPRDYRADRDAAEQYAATALLAGATVIVDSRVDHTDPPLPV